MNPVITATVGIIIDRSDMQSDCLDDRWKRNQIQRWQCIETALNNYVSGTGKRKRKLNIIDWSIGMDEEIDKCTFRDGYEWTWKSQFWINKENGIICYEYYEQSTRYHECSQILNLRHQINIYHADFLDSTDTGYLSQGVASCYLNTCTYPDVLENCLKSPMVNKNLMRVRNRPFLLIITNSPFQESSTVGVWYIISANGGQLILLIFIISKYPNLAV
jgi:hypothetical protein